MSKKLNTIIYVSFVFFQLFSCSQSGTGEAPDRFEELTDVQRMQVHFARIKVKLLQGDGNVVPVKKELCDDLARRLSKNPFKLASFLDSLPFEYLRELVQMLLKEPEPAIIDLPNRFGEPGGLDTALMQMPAGGLKDITTEELAEMVKTRLRAVRDMRDEGSASSHETDLSAIT